MILFYDKDINDYISPETLRLLQNNKWIKFLLLLPKEFFSLEDDSMHIILFIIYNEDEFDLKTKINIVRYLSGNHYGWNDHNDGYIRDFFEEINHSKKIYPMKIRNKTWNYVSSQCKKYANIEFSLLYNEYKRRDEAKRVQIFKQQKKKQDFLDSPLYHFIRQLTYKEGDIITSRDFYRKYHKFCKSNKLQTVSQNSFGKILSNYKIVSFRHKMVRSYHLKQENIDKFINYYGKDAYEAEVERRRQKAEIKAMKQEEEYIKQEAEHKKQEAEEAERKKQEAEEAERKKQEAEEAERRKQEAEIERKIHEYKRVQIYKQQKKKQDFLASPIYQFIRQLTYIEGEIITSKQLFERYVIFCETNKLQIVSQNSFGKILSNYKIVSFRHKMIRSYHLKQENINKFINYYGT